DAVFFSSRRRHTRSTRDWSSDVCSSDLRRGLRARVLGVVARPIVRGHPCPDGSSDGRRGASQDSPEPLRDRYLGARGDLDRGRRSEERRVGKSGEVGGGGTKKRKKEGGV